MVKNAIFNHAGSSLFTDTEVEKVKENVVFTTIHNKFSNSSPVARYEAIGGDIGKNAQGINLPIGVVNSRSENFTTKHNI